MKRFKLTAIIIALLLPFAVHAGEQKAAEKKSKKPVQEAPKVQRGYVPKADITITEGKDRLIKEYRINGELRAIKVTPTNGFPPYYLIDRDGTGNFFKVGPDMGEEIVIPNWILIEW